MVTTQLQHLSGIVTYFQCNDWMFDYWILMMIRGYIKRKSWSWVYRSNLTRGRSFRFTSRSTLQPLPMDVSFGYWQNEWHHRYKCVSSVWWPGSAVEIGWGAQTSRDSSEWVMPPGRLPLEDPQEDLESVAGERDIWNTLISLLPPQTDPG